ncbi:MAG: penicillin-binding transpeptidase domain-containing protein [Bdellovibrionota bacterium]
MAKIGMQGGKDLMQKVIHNFGFGQKTGIDFPAESPGLFDPNRKWRDMRLANLAFGQGISVTSIQMVQAMSVIANGGWLVQPYVVEKMITGTGKVLDVAPQGRKQKMYSEKTIAEMIKYLTAVTQPDGTGKRARIDGYEVAGKTGTAQIYDPKTQSYSHDHVVSSFLGFVPAENPAMVAYIVLYQPKEGEHGGTIAAPVFQNVMQNALPYMHIKQ